MGKQVCGNGHEWKTRFQPSPSERFCPEDGCGLPVTVLVTEQTITGEPVPPQGVLEVRKYAALSEDHARRTAARGLTDTEEIVSVEEAGKD